MSVEKISLRVSVAKTFKWCFIYQDRTIGNFRDGRSWAQNGQGRLGKEEVLPLLQQQQQGLPDFYSCYLFFPFFTSGIAGATTMQSRRGRRASAGPISIIQMKWRPGDATLDVGEVRENKTKKNKKRGKKSKKYFRYFVRRNRRKEKGERERGKEKQPQKSHNPNAIFPTISKRMNTIKSSKGHEISSDGVISD